MLSGRRMPEEEVCPVRDELLGELYHADENCVSDLVATVALDIRVLLALYCYHRSHLHTRGLAIAGSCDQDELVRLGGHVGDFLARSRETPSPAPVASAFVTRRAVTLATGPLRKMLPIDDELDEEGCEPVLIRPGGEHASL
jgi:hypothetical protein